MNSPEQTAAIAKRDYHEVIAKVAAVKDLDVDKLGKLLQLQEDWERRQAATHYNEQMALAQGEMSTISRDAVNPMTHSKYATLGKLDNDIRSIYTKFGFSISFDEELDRDGWVHVIGMVSCGSETRRYHRWLPWSNQGIRGQAMSTPTHANMGAITYARRALLKNIFNLAEEDDDGNSAGGANRQTREIDRNITPPKAEALKPVMDMENSNDVKTGGQSRHGNGGRLSDSEHTDILTAFDSARTLEEARAIRKAALTRAAEVKDRERYDQYERIFSDTKRKWLGSSQPDDLGDQP